MDSQIHCVNKYYNTDTKNIQIYFVLGWVIDILTYVVLYLSRSCIRKCQDPNLVENELKKLLDVYGSNDLISLGDLRRSVSLFLGKNEMVSGEQQDCKEFIDDLLSAINPMFTNLFKFEERS